MATKEQKQLLIDTLKFTPRTYKIQMWGYGGEKVMGTVDPRVWDYCIKHRVDLQDHAWDSDAAEEFGINPDMLPFPPGSWYECDSMGHTNGVSRDAGYLRIEDENGETVIEENLGEFDGGDDSPELFCEDEIWIGSRNKGEVVFVGSSNEKGTFFEGDIELTAPFDITKLGLHYEEFDGEDIVYSVSYNGEDIDNYGGSTDGKSSDMIMVRLIDDNGNFERYDPSAHETGTDNPVDFPDSVCTSEEWDPVAELDKIVFELPETTDWFSADIKPVHVGLYEIMINAVGTWPFPNTAYYTWTGKGWKDVDGKKAKIYQWRGLTEKVE